MVVEFDDPSYEELKELVAAQQLLIEQQTPRLAELEARIVELERRVGRNPRNSSMPPSAEGLSKPPANRAERRQAKRRPGKQPGDEGHHLAQVGDPDEVVTHRPRRCPSCEGDLSEAEIVSVERRQVFEVPRTRAHVTEHQLVKLRCSCGCETKAPAPNEATAPACYGPGVRALAVYLSVYQHVPYDRLAEIFTDVLSMPVSVGAIKAMVAEAGGGLGLFLDVVAELLEDTPAVHFDETGGRVEGSLHWVHVASTSLYTLLVCHKRRDGGHGRHRRDRQDVRRGRPRRLEALPRLRGRPCLVQRASPPRAPGRVRALRPGLGRRDDRTPARRQRGRGKGRAKGSTRLDATTLHSIRVRYGKLVAKGWAVNDRPTTAPLASGIRTPPSTC